MNSTPFSWGFLWRSRALQYAAVLGTFVILFAWGLRKLAILTEPTISAQLQLTSGILAFTLAGISLVKFRGTRDRLSLIFAGGFLILGFALVSSSLVFIHPSLKGYSENLRDPMAWVVSRTLLALLLLAGLVAARRFPTTRYPSREIAGALVVVVLLTSLLSATHWQLPADLVVQPGAAIPRPGNLLPAALFLMAAIGFNVRYRQNHSLIERSFCTSSVLNFACCLAASQSDRVFDAPFAFAEILQFGGYAVLLGGALFDNARLFEDIRELAASDPLTGLANYRRMTEVLGNEIERAKRNGKPFALVLFDLDGLKKINDHYGHLVGTRAICRVADALRIHSRTIDTAARQGGDEFALVLPETDGNGASEVATRVCARVSHDQEAPPISISAGCAVYPDDGETIEGLLAAADRSLYKMKRGETGSLDLTNARVG